ncbi:MAG: asparagine synthase (glutamine-hydrolyzing) [Armatimonadota bacterium]
MCGICGFISRGGHDPKTARATLVGMCRTMVHRGPDDEGLHIDDFFAVGMRRLSIIDLEGGHQPIYNEDGSIGVVLNGEIYNFQELRDKLIAQGHRFTTKSDTEVIVHLYEEMGADCVSQMNGMFAFAVWDLRKRELLLVRDRLGVKPLYYYECSNGLVFGSELKALLAHPWVPRDVDLTSLDDYLCYLYVPSPRSIVKGVYKLPPAHRAVYKLDNGSWSIERYWSLNFKPNSRISESEAVDELLELLQKAVRDRLVCDVPFGAFLSGGLDSSTVVGFMSRCMDAPVRTFSVGWQGLEGDETEHAKRVALWFGTQHEELVVETNDLVGLILEVADYLDEPLGDPSTAPAYLMSKAARRKVKMVLTGDGGDELFAGYTGFPYNALVDRISKVPLPLRRFLLSALRFVRGAEKAERLLRQAERPLSERWSWSRAVLKPEARAYLYSPELLSALDGHCPGDFIRSILNGNEGLDTVSRLQQVLISHYLPDDVLTKADRASMAASLEVRSPLLDYRLFEFSARLPAGLKLRGLTTKYLLRRAVRDLLPPDITRRPKQGFTPPTDHWFRGELYGFVRDLLLSRTCTGRGYFRRDALEAVLEEHRLGSGSHGDRLWALVMLELWHRNCLDRSGVVTSEVG